MKERQNIDDFFKQGVAGFRAEPSGKVWDNIEAGFFTKKGISSRLYYLGAALLLLLLTAGGIWYFGSRNDQQSKVTKNKVIELPKVEYENKKTEPAHSSVRKNAAQLQQDESADLAKGSLKVEKEIIREESKVDEKAETTNAISINPELNYKANEPAGNETRIDKHLSRLSPLWIDILINHQAGFIDPTKIEGMEKYLAKQRKSHFYTGASANAGMIYYPSTTDQFTWSAGLNFGLTAGKFYFETGIDYYDTKERGIYSIELRSFDSVGYYNKVESFEIDLSNPDQIIYNTKKVTVFDSTNHYKHTTPFFKYQYINIPVSVGYKFFSKDRFTASVNTGIILSLMTNKNIPEVKYFDPEYTIVRIENNTPERVDMNLIWKLGIRLNYKLTGSVSLSAEPVFTKYLNSIYNTNKGYSDVKPYLMGLRVGIFYGF